MGILSNSRNLLLLAFLALGPVFARAGDGALRLESGLEILTHWEADQHVYVVGEIGVAEKQLAELEKWIDANATNWTVLLLEDAIGEGFVDAEDQVYRGIDAVEHGMGKGLPSKTGFGSLKDSQSGQANGAFFILSLKERNIFYYGSESYRQFGLGEEAWKGRLDRAAIAAMRNGGRIVEAAKGTIELVDGEYEKARSRKSRENQRVIQEASARLQALERKFKEAKVVSDQLMGKLDENAGGALAGNQFDTLNQELLFLKEDVERGDLNGFEGRAATLERRVEFWMREASKYLRDETQIERLEGEVERLASKADSLGKMHEMIEVALVDAKEEYHQGNPGYRNSLGQVQVRIDGFHRMQSQIESRRKSRLMMVAVSIGFLVLLGWICNRQRRRIKSESERLLKERREAMSEMSDRLFAVMDRAGVVVGPIDELDSRGYSGVTLQLSREALEKVDEGFVLSSNVQKIIEEAGRLIEPESWLSRLRNFFNGGRYEQAVDLLDAEMRVEAAKVPEMNERSRPGEERDEVFSMPIDEWKGRTRDALEDAEERLDEIDRSWTTIVGRREELGNAIEGLSKEQIDHDDPWLACEQIAEVWLPAMSELHLKGVEIGQNDPVSALRGPIPEAERMVEEAGRLRSVVEHFRRDHWQEIESGEASLDSRKRATIWVDATLEDLGKRCDEIAMEGVEKSVAEGIDELVVRLEEFASRMALAVRLAESADEELKPALQSAQTKVESERRELAAILKLENYRCLVEEGRNPTEYLKEATLQFEGALAALDLGSASSAGEFLDEAKALIEQALFFVSESKRSLSEYPAASEGLWGRRGDLDDLVKTAVDQVEVMRDRYAPPALFVDPDREDLGSFRDAPVELEGYLVAIVKCLDQAKTGQAEGRLLESWDLLEDGRALAKAGEELCQEVGKRPEELKDLESRNLRGLEVCRRNQEDLRFLLADRRVMKRTLLDFENFGVVLNSIEEMVGEQGGKISPYAAEDLLKEAGLRGRALHEGIADDLAEHGKAAQLLESVKVALGKANRLVLESRTDRITDSTDTVESVGKIESREREFEEAGRDLQSEHGDWRELQDRLRRIHLGLSEALLELDRKLKMAREAVRLLESASKEVRRASGWQGSFNVRINGRPGGDALDRANEDLLEGRYQSAMEWAGRAASLARSAISSAEAEEAARRLAERRRKAQRAQAARRWRMRSSGFGASSSKRFSGSRSSMFGGGGTRRGGFSSGRSSASRRSSSVGRSSFSLRSGVGKSGW